MVGRRFDKRLNIIRYWIKPPALLRSFSVFVWGLLRICLVSYKRNKHGENTGQIRWKYGEAPVVWFNI